MKSLNFASIDVTVESYCNRDGDGGDGDGGGDGGWC
jgi:hypothetical protein